MAEGQLIKGLFQNFIGSSGTQSGHTYDTFPDNDDTAVTAGDTVDIFGAYASIVTTVGSSDVWFYGAQLTALSAATDAKVAFATGASGSQSDFAVFPYTRTDLSTVGVNPGQIYIVPVMVRIAASARLWARSKAGSASATINVVALFGTGFIG